MRKFFSLIAAVLFAGSMMATEVTVSKTVEELATANSWANGTVVTPFALDEVITVSTNATDVNTGKYYSSGQQVRLYQSGAAELIISAAEGYTISSITVEYVSEKGGIFAETASGVAVPYENVQSATFTVGNSGEATNGQARVTAISVTYNGEGGVTPPPADTYTVAGNDAAIFGEAWNPALAANDMTLTNGIYKWEKAELNLTAGTIQFKVVKNHSWDIAYPAQNYELNIAEEGEYTLTITFDPSNEAVAAEAVKNEPLADPTNCAEAAEAALSVSANNELYNDGAVYTIEGYVTGIKTAYSDQYHNISFWMADAADGGEVLQAYRAACASEADAPKVGDKVAVTGSLTKYGTTPEFAAGCTYVITEPYIPVEPEINYYVVGSMTNWAINADYKLAANSANEGEFMGEFAFENGAEFKVVSSADGEAIVNWFPAGMNNNYQITEAGDYTVYFRPEGGVDGWHEGYINAVKKEAPIVHQYEVAEAIAASLQDDEEILVRGVITKMEFKGKNFAKYGSVNIYVADVNGAEGEFEFYNCYSLNADTFRTSIPNYDPESTSWAQFREVVDANGNAIHVGDTVIAFGKYKLYNSTHELNTGCYLVDIKHAPVAPADTIALDFNTENTTYAFVDNKYFVEYGTTDIYLSDINVNTSTNAFEGDGNYLVLDFYPENANNVTGVYQAQDETLDLEYTYMLTINGTDTAFVEFADGAIQVEIGEVNKELGLAQLAVGGTLISTEGDIYAITALVIAYYDFLPEEGVEDVVLDPKAIKRLVNGNVVIIKNGVHYNVNGQVIK